MLVRTYVCRSALHCESSALLRHEVAYVLGQTQSDAAVDDLISRLSDANESGHAWLSSLLLHLSSV